MFNFKFLHSFHNESKCAWTFIDAIPNAERDFAVVSWQVTCSCGFTAIRKRAYPLWYGEGKKYCFEYTIEEIIEKAKISSGDNYHL